MVDSVFKVGETYETAGTGSGYKVTILAANTYGLIGSAYLHRDSKDNPSFFFAYDLEGNYKGWIEADIGKLHSVDNDSWYKLVDPTQAPVVIRVVYKTGETMDKGQPLDIYSLDFLSRDAVGVFVEVDGGLKFFTVTDFAASEYGKNLRKK